MRLVCPNCSAQYEVDASMIPEEGRDVQCSNCGHTWFELPPAHAGFDAGEDADADAGLSDAGRAFAAASEDEEEDDGFDIDLDDIRTTAKPSDDDDDVVGQPEDVADVEPATDDDAEDDATTASTDDDATVGDTEDDGPIEDDPEDDDATDMVAASVAAAGKARRPADAADVDLLREEAERELSRRAMPPDGLETQTDMGLDEMRNRATPSRALRARMAHLGEEPEPAPAAPPKPVEVKTSKPQDEDYNRRRDLLPDIDEINSTLKSTKRREEVAPEQQAQRRSGFRAGFFLTILAVIVLIFVYAQAPAIARALPGSEPTLIAYVDGANALRDWIDGFLAN